MKIADPSYIINIEALKHRTPAGQEAAPEPPRPVDRVTLSPQARELMEARRMLAAVPDVRENKIADLKARIEAGTYRIDSAAIAEKMIKDAVSEDD